MTVVATALVPGLPHLLAAEPAPGWRDLAQATRELGVEIRAAGAETLLVVSTQWISVLGLQVQTRPVVEGTRVDENWYPFDYGTIPYRLRTDVAIADRWLSELRVEGFQTHPTDHPHFPIDTGLLVATRLLDPEGTMAVAQVSLNLYGTPETVEQVGAAAVRAASGAGRKVALVAISSLSALPLKRWIEPAEDRIASPLHEHWNRRILDLLAAGKCDEVFALREEYSAVAAADSQLRALSFLAGGSDLTKPARIRAYAPVWGMGAAVIDWAN